MRKGILSIPITLDGYVDGPNQKCDWVIAGDELHDLSTHRLEYADLVLLGRMIYKVFANYWPKTQPGRDMLLCSGASIAQASIQQQLVNQLELNIQPVAIGRDKSLFSGIDHILKMDFLWNSV